jgi:hypothetical protein
MADEVFHLFDDYAARFARGERPDTREYLARAGEGADELAAMIDRFLQAAPVPAAGEDERTLAAAWIGGEAPLLALRNRRALKRDAVVDALITAFGLDPAKREKVKGYYHRLETGLLEPRRVDGRVFEVLAETLRASLTDVRAWRPQTQGIEAAYMRRDAEAAPSMPPLVLAGEAGERDEIDLLFLGGEDGS